MQILCLFLCRTDFWRNPFFAACRRFRLLIFSDLCLLARERFFNRQENQKNGKDDTGDRFQSDKREGDHIFNCLRLLCGNRHTVYKHRRNISGFCDQGIEKTGCNTDGCHGKDVVNGHCHAVRAHAAFPFEVIQPVGKKRHKNVSAWEPSDVLYKLPDKNNRHIRRHGPADGTSDRIENESRKRHVPLAELLCQRPHGKDADAHGNAADNRDHRLRHTVVICAEDIIAIINKTDIFQRCTEGIDEEIDKHENHVFVGQHYFQLRQKRQLFFFRAGLLLRYALFGKVIFKKRQRQGKDGKNAHHDYPFGLVHAKHGHDRHWENQRHDDAAHHNGGNLIEHRKTAALNRVARGERAHQVVRHIVNRVCQRIKQVVGQHDPDDLNRFARVRNGEKKNSRQRNERS